MNLSSPWSVQIAMLPVRRVYLDETRDQRHLSRQQARALGAKIKGQNATKRKHAALMEVIAAGPADGLSFTEIADLLKQPRKNGNLRRQLEVMADDGKIDKYFVNAHHVRWRLPCR